MTLLKYQTTIWKDKLMHLHVPKVSLIVMNCALMIINYCTFLPQETIYKLADRRCKCAAPAA